MGVRGHNVAKYNPIALLGLAVLVGLCGCTSTKSTAQPQDGTHPQMFQLTETAADKLLLKAMSEQYPGHPISRVELPNKGYQTVTRFALDSDNVVAYMVPTKGRAPNGEIVGGYVFKVSRSGTMVLSGSIRASNLFRRIVRKASAEAKPLPLVQ